MSEHIAAALSNSQAPRLETCPTHGAYESKNVWGRIWTGCPLCAKAEREQEEAAAAAKKRAEQQEAWQQRLGSSGIPKRFQDRTLKNFAAETPEQKRALAFATAYADSFDSALKTGRSALFIGRIGTGKTHLAAGIGLRLMHRDKRTVLFTTVVRAIRKVKDTWSRGSVIELYCIEYFVYILFGPDDALVIE
jgi:DNA replication protein DnaC